MKKTEDFIEIKDLIRILYIKKYFIIIVSILFGVTSFLIAELSDDFYIVETTFVPDIGSNANGSSALKGLASFAGINTTGSLGGSEKIMPLMYPEIVQSLSYKRKLLTINVSDSLNLANFLLQNRSHSFTDLLKQYTIGIPGLIFSNNDETYESFELISSSSVSEGVNVIEPIEAYLHGQLAKMISISFSETEGFSLITVQMADPYVAALVANKSRELLQEKVIDFKLKTANESLKLIREQYSERYLELLSLEDSLAIIMDKNKNISTSLAKLEVSRLERRLSSLSSVVQELAQAVEKAKLKVTEDTPVFQVLNPAIVPLNPSFPKKSLILIFSGIIGFILAVIFVLFKDSLLNMIKGVVQS